MRDSTSADDRTVAGPDAWHLVLPAGWITLSTDHARREADSGRSIWEACAGLGWWQRERRLTSSWGVGVCVGWGIGTLFSLGVAVGAVPGVHDRSGCRDRHLVWGTGWVLLI